MVIRGEDAHRLHLATLTQAARYTPNWRLGAATNSSSARWPPRPKRRLWTPLRRPARTMDLGLLYRALAPASGHDRRQLTDGPIQALGLTMLRTTNTTSRPTMPFLSSVKKLSSNGRRSRPPSTP